MAVNRRPVRPLECLSRVECGHTSSIHGHHAHMQVALVGLFVHEPLPAHEREGEGNLGRAISFYFFYLEVNNRRASSWCVRGLLKVNINPPGMNCAATGARHGLMPTTVFQYENVHTEAKDSWDIPAVILES